MPEEQPAHRQRHHHHTDDEERAHLQHAEEERTRQTADGTEDEVERGGEGCLVKRHAQALHQYFWCGGVGTHINAYMAHDTEERQQHDGRSQQLETLHEGGRLALNRRFLNRSHK